MGKIILAAIAAYIGYALWLSHKNNMLTLPFVAEPEDEPLTPGMFADQLYEYLVKQSGFKLFLHPTVIAKRDMIFQHILTATDDQINQMVASWNAKFRDKGSLVKVVNLTPGDPFDNTHIKTRVLNRLNGLNIK